MGSVGDAAAGELTSGLAVLRHIDDAGCHEMDRLRVPTCLRSTLGDALTSGLDHVAVESAPQHHAIGDPVRRLEASGPVHREVDRHRGVTGRVAKTNRTDCRLHRATGEQRVDRLRRLLHVSKPGRLATERVRAGIAGSDAQDEATSRDLVGRGRLPRQQRRVTKDHVGHRGAQSDATGDESSSGDELKRVEDRDLTICDEQPRVVLLLRQSNPGEERLEIRRRRV